MNIQEGDEVGYSEYYLFSVEHTTHEVPSPQMKKRRGIAGKSQGRYREVLWEDTNCIVMVNESWLQKIN